ncbi:uncharacterized protein LOC133883534 isoform X2 [Phragmites australis]|uniref:uncharacterized protein LOC133883534 isoform X2 n=1 Tax=Phragmites australis TaxID=29695 RepID=UPI002D7919E6|nr:uncharacterized protein LOC133883534 isoform X2 [Phragmites australis]
MTETDRHLRPAPPPLAPPATTLSQAEEGSATATASEMEEKCPKIKAKEHLEAGAAVAVFGFIVLLGWICLPKEAKHPSKVHFTVSLLLAIATFLSGSALVMLSMTMLGLREHLVSGSQRVASKCLLVTCAALSVLTLLSLLAQLPGRVYWYVGLAVVTPFLLLAAGVHWYLRRHGDNGDEAAANEEEHKEELDAVSKVTSCVTTSAFGGLVGVLFSVSKIFGAAADAATGAAYAAIFFMFTTAISGVFVMTVLKKVPKITNHRFQRLFIGAMSLANAFLLCSLACAAFAAAFVVLRVE